MLTQKELVYCIRCGKQIDVDSKFCTHCGAIQKLEKESNSDTHTKEKYNEIRLSLSTKEKIGITLTGIWILIHLAMLFASPLEDGDVDYRIWFVDTDFSEFEAYGWGEFFFYAILFPAIAYGFTFVYKTSKKIALYVLSFFIICFGGYWIYGKYAEYKKENVHIINREFCGCRLGDSYSKVYKSVNEKYGNHIIRDLTNDHCIKLSNVTYGNNQYDSLKFDFYKGDLYRVYFVKKYSSYDRRNAGYKNFMDLFEDKNYPHDRKYDKYSNCYYYSDKFTELTLRYSVYEFDGNEISIQITYYDKKSNKIGAGL